MTQTWSTHAPRPSSGTSSISRQWERRLLYARFSRTASFSKAAAFVGKQSCCVRVPAVAGGHCLEKPLALLEAAAYMHTPHSLHTWLNGFYPLGSNLVDIRMAALQVCVPAASQASHSHACCCIPSAACHPHGACIVSLSATEYYVARSYGVLWTIMSSGASGSERWRVRVSDMYGSLYRRSALCNAQGP